MKLAVNTLIWAVDFTPAQLPLLAKLKAHGFEGVEIPVFDPAAFDAPAIRKGLEQQGLECVICSVMPPGFSLITDDSAVLAKSRQRLRDAIRIAADMNSKVVAGPLYCPVGDLPGRRRTNDEWRRAIESYQGAIADLEANDVTLAIEPLNRFETYFLNTSDDLARLCDEVGHARVGASYDTFHSNIEDKGLGRGIRTLGRHIKHVQTCENDRGTPGSGHVSWDDVFAALRDIGYDQWLSIESFAPNLGDFSSAVCIWRDIEPNTDDIAFEGIRFLKKHV